MKAVRPAIQSSDVFLARRTRPTAATCFSRVNTVLVVKRDNACGTQDRLAQPSDAEEQEKQTDCQLQWMERDTLEKRPE